MDFSRRSGRQALQLQRILRGDSPPLPRRSSLEGQMRDHERELRKMYVTDGMTAKAIAAKFGVSPGGVSQRLMKDGITKNKKSGGKKMTAKKKPSGKKVSVHGFRVLTGRSAAGALCVGDGREPRLFDGRAFGTRECPRRDGSFRRVPSRAVPQPLVLSVRQSEGASRRGLPRRGTCTVRRP